MDDVALSSAAVAIVVKRAVMRVALAVGMTTSDAAVMAEAFAGHSLRAGHATSAAQNDAPGHAVQGQLRHKSFNTTADYIRERAAVPAVQGQFDLVCSKIAGELR